MTEEQFQIALNRLDRAARPKSHNALAIAGLVVAIIVPIGAVIGWTMSLSNRVAVLEAASVSLQTASAEIAALKQEVSDFRGEFREWKRDNVRRGYEGSAPYQKPSGIAQ